MEQQPISSWSEGDLIRHVAHELRQSTTVALGWSEILARGDFGFTSQEQKQALLDIFHHLKIIAEVNQWLNIWQMSKDQDEAERLVKKCYTQEE